MGNSTPYLGSMQSHGQSDMNQKKAFIPNEFEDEPPLLEGKLLNLCSCDNSLKLLKFIRIMFTLSPLYMNV